MGNVGVKNLNEIRGAITGCRGRVAPAAYIVAPTLYFPMSSASDSPALTRDDIASWPKAELHCHLDGSMRLETMLDLARKEGKRDVLPADSVDGLREELREVERSDTLEAYLAWFQYTIPLLQTTEALRRAAYELAEDNAAENVQYLEVRYSPILHAEEGLSLEEANDAVLDGLTQAEQDFDITTSLIVCGLRDRYESASMRLAELAVEYKHEGIVAFDLAGGIENAKVRGGIYPATCRPLPAAHVGSGLIVKQFTGKVTLSPAPIDEQVLGKKAGHHHPHPVMHIAGGIELAHTGIYEWITRFSVAPGGKVGFVVFPGYVVVFGFERFI